MEENNNIAMNLSEYQSFRNDVLRRIRSAQYEAMRAVNKEMISLYWEIGRQITEPQKALGWDVWDNFRYFLFVRGCLCFFNGMRMRFSSVYQEVKIGTNFDVFFLNGLLS